MKFRAIALSILLLFFALAMEAKPVLAAVNLTISSPGDGVFTVYGSGLTGVEGMDITINYDATTLGIPNVAQGSLIGSALMMPNATTPGTVRVAIVTSSPISGSGTIFTLTFPRKGASPGSIGSMSASLIGSNVGIPATTQVFNPTSVQQPGPETKDKDKDKDKDKETSAPTPPQTVTTEGGVPAVLGTVTMPGEGTSEPPARKEEAVSAPAAEPATQGVTETPAEAPAAEKEEAAAPAEKEKRLVTRASVLKQFADYKGEMTPEALVALFKRSEEKGFSQEPPVGLTDGKSTVKTVVEIERVGRAAPNFALKGARMVSLKRGEGNAWIIVATPAKGALEATLTVLNDSTVVELPLTVAPPIGAAAAKNVPPLTEAGFRQFLKERGTVEVPRHDLNGDKKRDYIDDYIFTANYLIARWKATPPAKEPSDAKHK